VLCFEQQNNLIIIKSFAEALVFGGRLGHRYTSQLWRVHRSGYTLETANRGLGPSARGAHTAVLFGTRMIVFGGRGNDFVELDELWVLDIGMCKYSTSIKTLILLQRI